MPQHIDSTIAALSETWFFGPTFGPKYGALLRREIALRNDEQALDAALALGGYFWHTEDKKRKRHALRAVLLATFVMKKQPISLRDNFCARFEPMLLQDLKSEFTHLFPAFFDNNNRDTWDPSQFTSPVTLRAFLNPEDWTVRPPPAYKLMIHTVRKGAEVLYDPSKLSTWTAISMSVLSSTKPICYSNHGLVLRVPKNNIISASPTDQWFDNYAGTDRSVKAPGQSMAKHIAEKNLKIGGLLTPDEIVRLQNTQDVIYHSAGEMPTKHNEVVVCGVAGQRLPHGITGTITLVAVFVQIRMNGTFPRDYKKSQGASDVILLEAGDAARRNMTALIYLPTTDIPPGD